MKLRSIEIRNFRCFEHLSLRLDGGSIVFVGPNAAGKSAILEAIGLALAGGEIVRADIRDLDEAVEITATLTDIAVDEQGVFADAIDFRESPPVVRMTQQAIWDPHERQVQQSHVFPDDGLRGVSRQARETIRLVQLPAWRDPSRLLSLLGRRSFLATLIAELPLDDELEEAIATLAGAAADLSHAAPMQDLMGRGRSQLARLLPGVPEDAFSIGSTAAEPADILRQLQLRLALTGQALPVGDQSSGLGQASVFAFALELVETLGGAIVLVDEPERGLHPQAQRALLGRLQTDDIQSVVATHSAAVLDRRDPRIIARLRRGASGSTLFRAAGMSEADATTLSRYSTSLTAEAVFAETVIFVEGFSDFLAVRVFADTLGIDLDAAGVSLISLEGAGLLKHYLALLGPGGLDVEMRGLCDADEEATWIDLLNEAGIAVVDRSTLNAKGFQVADDDLEAELYRALGEAGVDAVIAAEGGSHELQLFEAQPAIAGMNREEMTLAFLSKAKAKIKWAPLLAAAVGAADVPTPIVDLLGDL